MDWYSVSSNVDSVSDCGGSEGTDPEDEALDSPVDLCSSLKLWSWSLGRDLKNEMVDPNS